MLRKKVGIVLAAMFFVLPSAVFAAPDAGMVATEEFATGAIKVFGLVILIGINLLWLVFPGGAAFLSYSYYKKKNEQSAQEDLGVKAAISIFGAAVVGFMAAYFAVGWVGQMAGNKSTLTEGNKFIIGNFIGSLSKHYKNKLEH